MQSRIYTLFGDKLDKLKNKKVAVIGVGTLGTCIVSILSKLPLREILTIDRDYVDESNLSTSLFYRKMDINNTTKVEAVKREVELLEDTKLNVNCLDLNGKNINLIKDYDLIFDATDNLETRFLLNDFSIKHRKPWIFSSVIGLRGMSYFFNGKKPCFKCLVKNYPQDLETCETSGIFPGISSIISSHSVFQAVSFLINGKIGEKLFFADLEENKFLHLKLNREKNCPTCIQKNFQHLTKRSNIISICGIGKYQISPERDINLENLKEKLKNSGKLKEGEGILFFKKNETSMTLFPNGRAIIQNVRDEKTAKSFYSKFVGN